MKLLKHKSLLRKLFARERSPVSARMEEKALNNGEHYHYIKIN